MRTIGFGGTYYTEWDIESEKIHVALGAWYYEVKCTYIKNLSKNLSEAIAKSGITNVDEDLKGKKRSFSYDKPLVLEPRLITERERLFVILLRNDAAHLAEGVRKSAFERALELKYIVRKEHGEEEYIYGKGEIFVKDVYEWQGDLRDIKAVWYSKEVGVYFKGIV